MTRLRPLLLVFLALLAALGLLLLGGLWRAAGVGPQVQVPMFYDAHYLFPRPWTQAQEAPGVPDPAPLPALYGPNRVTQAFVAGADRLALVELWLAGEPGTVVLVSLSTPAGTVYGGEIVLDNPAGRYYQLRLPTIAQARGQTFVLTLAAPTADSARPVTTRAVGGDRLGSAIRLNEYSRPGNLELYTYSAGGLPGRWWLDALGEQLLPALFRLRVQQYKPPAFKGGLFTGLLLLMLLLTAVFLVLARPGRQTWRRAAGWAAVLLLGGFLAWQLGSGRVRLPWPTRPVTLAAVDAPLALTLPNPPEPRHSLNNDLLLTLWTAQRLPEERFVHTQFAPIGEDEAFAAALRVPAASAVSYAVTVPLNGTLFVGMQTVGEGALRFTVRAGTQVLYDAVRTAADGLLVAELSLYDLAGQETTLTLATEPVAGQPEGLWRQPQLWVDPTWLHTGLPADAYPAGATFGETLRLVGYRLAPAQPRPGEEATLTLYWQPLVTVDANPKVFVHVLNPAGEILAQHDAQPLLNTYPVSVWQPGTIIADPHPLLWPEGDGLSLAVGLYDPATLARWPVTGPNGAADRAVLPLEPQP